MKHKYYPCADDERCKSIEEYLQEHGEKTFDFIKWKNRRPRFFTTWIDSTIIVEPENTLNS